jgi:hypothetical protein
MVMSGRKRPRNVAVLQHVPGRGIVPNTLIEPSRFQGERLRINVLFTEFEATNVALRRALDLAFDLDAETNIIVPHVVPYPLDLESPAVSLEFTCNRLRLFAESVGTDPYVYVYLCRDVMDPLRTVLPADSIVVLGSPKQCLAKWRIERFARKLTNNGGQVILAQY